MAEEVLGAVPDFLQQKLANEIGEADDDVISLAKTQ